MGDFPCVSGIGSIYTVFFLAQEIQWAAFVFREFKNVSLWMSNQLTQGSGHW